MSGRATTTGSSPTTSSTGWSPTATSSRWVSYVSGHRYGTPRSEIDRIRATGKAPLLDLETQGALRVRDEVPGAVTIFIDVPSFAELERRLRDRATESAGEIHERLELARRQREQAGEFDHVVVNDDLERAARRARGARQRSTRRRGYHLLSMIHPKIDQLLENVDSRYALVIVAAKRARQINNYYHQLGEGTFEVPPPLVESRPRTT